jgi:hypothetical protein
MLAGFAAVLALTVASGCMTAAGGRGGGAATAAQMPSRSPQDRPLPPIDWGTLSNYFEISDLKFESKDIRIRGSGQVVTIHGLTFLARAKHTMYVPLFSAQFLDADGVKVDEAILYYGPTRTLGFRIEAGERTRGWVDRPTKEYSMVRFVEAVR